MRLAEWCDEMHARSAGPAFERSMTTSISVYNSTTGMTASASFKNRIFWHSVYACFEPRLCHLPPLGALPSLLPWLGKSQTGKR